MTRKTTGAKQCAIFFFILGTMLFLLQLIWTGINTITAIGFYFTAIAVLCNAFFILVLLVGLLLKENLIDTLKAIGLICINIPVAIGYAYITLEYAL